jgi:hypothetical protein
MLRRFGLGLVPWRLGSRSCPDGSGSDWWSEVSAAGGSISGSVMRSGSGAALGFWLGCCRAAARLVVRWVSTHRNGGPAALCRNRYR